MYDDRMRTTNRPRPASGIRLAGLRKAAGLSQKELAERLDIAPSNIGFWELHDKPPRSDLLPKLAQVLGVTVEEILGTKIKPRPAGGPQGRAKRVFDDLSKLPRRQQTKIVDVVEALVTQAAH